ncbi:nSTAND1 domain-containing NTPase [Nocardia gamkensis]|uniref:nSTAND1 domain-containing NTPase n=1 Tax=Nocardia gamkensis TaxID=352869 RepID=UPI0037C522B4
MIEEVELFPVGFGIYDNHDPVEVDEEIGKVAELLHAFDAHCVDWDVDMAARGGDEASARLREWSAGRAVGSVLYWVGHGWSDGISASLAHAHSDAQVRSDGISPARVADAIEDRDHSAPGSWVLVLIEACRSSRFISNLSFELSTRGVAKVALLLVGGMSGEGATDLGRIREVMSNVLNGTHRGVDVPLTALADEFESSGGTVARQHLTGRILRRRQTPAVNVPLDVSAEFEAALAALTEDERRHFLPKAHGGDLGVEQAVLVEQSWFFVGRDREVRDIVGWLTTDDSDSMLVITGPAGVGKSALLGHMVVSANPRLRAALRRIELLPDGADTPIVPAAAFDAVLHLTGATAAEVITRLARATGVDERPPEQMSQAVAWLTGKLSEYPQRLTILLDALDEAIDALTVARLLASVAATPGVRVLVGTRAGTRDDPDHGASDNDLLDALGPAARLVIGPDGAAVREYATSRLQRAAAAGTLPRSFDIEAFAARLGDRARGFLFARLAVHEVVADRVWRDPATWSGLLGGSHQDLFGIAVTRLSRRAPAYSPLLQALAYGRGRGIPAAGGIWATCASVLAPEALISLDDITALLTDAAPYIVADREHGQTVYRLAHRAFTEFFTDETTTTDRDREIHRAMLRAIIDSCEDSLSSGKAALNPYVTYMLSGHAAVGGEPAWHLLDSHTHILTLLDPDAIARDILRAAFGLFILPPAIGGILTVAATLRRLDIADRLPAIQLATARHTGHYRDSGIGTHPWTVALGWAVLRPRQPHRILTGHTDGVLSIAALQVEDGRTLLASAGRDRTVRLWDPMTGDMVGSPLVGHGGAVTAVAVIPGADGRPLLASGSTDATVRLWDPMTGDMVGSPLVGHDGAVTAVAVIPGADGRPLLASGSTDATVRRWDPETGSMIGTPLSGHVGAVTAIVAIRLRNGQTVLATGVGAGDTLRWFDLETGEGIGQRVVGPSGAVEAVVTLVPRAEDRRSLRLPGAGQRATVRLWDLSSSEPIGEPLPGHVGWVSALTAVTLPDGRIALAVTGGTTTRMWDPATRKPIGQTLTGHAYSVKNAAIVPVPDGSTLLATSGVDKTTRLWDLNAGMLVGTPLIGHHRAVSAIAAVPLRDRRTLLATGSDDKTIRVWDPMGQPLAAQTNAVTAIAAIPRKDARTLLVTADDRNTMRIWDPTAGQQVGRPLTGHTARITAMGAVPHNDGRTLLITADDRNSILIWDPTTGEQIGNAPTGRNDRIIAIAAVPYAPDRTLVATTSGVAVRLWDPITGERVRTRPSGPIEWTAATASTAATRLDDGQVVLVTKDANRTLRLCHPTIRGLPHSLRSWRVGRASALATVALPDGRELLATTNTDDWTLRLRNPKTGIAVGPAIDCDPGRLMNASATCHMATTRFEDGRVVVAVAFGRMLRIVHLLSGEPLAGFDLGADITCMCSTGDAELAVGLEDGVALLRISSVRHPNPPAST